MDYNKIFSNNELWIEEKLKLNKNYFQELAKSQNPDFLYIGCSDSRVNATELMGLEPGQVFVHRNIANVVSGNDLNTTSVIEYAVTHLKVKHIVVCGHYNCGGVTAAMSSQDLGLLNPWLRNIRDVFRLHKKELLEIPDEVQRNKRLTELNVQEQCINVIKMACVQKRYVKDGFPIVHGWIFDLSSGKLMDLNIDFDTILNNIQEIYNLTDENWSINKI